MQLNKGFILVFIQFKAITTMINKIICINNVCESYLSPFAHFMHFSTFSINQTKDTPIYILDSMWKRITLLSYKRINNIISKIIFKKLKKKTQFIAHIYKYSALSMEWNRELAYSILYTINILYVSVSVKCHEYCLFQFIPMKIHAE